jgi:hypothetical protein
MGEGIDRAALAVNESADSRRAFRIKRTLAVAASIFAALLWAQALRHGQVPSVLHLLLAILVFALYTNRGGRVLRDWLPVFIVMLLYAASAEAVHRYNLSVITRPQLDLENGLFNGSIPTVWLQTHIGEPRWLAAVSALVYLSHFLAPLALAFFLWAFLGAAGVSDLLFGILIVTVLGEITFVLLPTAPPWLAAEHGLLPSPHPVLKDGLSALGHDKLASLVHTDSYDTVAAIPSLHVAWPVLGFLVAGKYGLPRPVVAVQAAFTCAIVFVIVYMGEHYVVDAVVGVGYALAAWKILQSSFERRVGPECSPPVSGSGLVGGLGEGVAPRLAGGTVQVQSK